ncbi:MAG: translocation/assembly module TamB domain-containing protein [Bacteroidales bacterium]|nr:translocation/assembly module TamB domain-containing protein [Bacteroidales bacterium]
MKKTLKIVGRFAAGLFLVVYFVVALCCTTLVQTLIGSTASNYFSKAWGGKVRITYVAINPLGSVDLRDIELIHPDGDTIFDCSRLAVRFSGIPVSDEGLNLRSVVIDRAYFHLVSVDTGGINLQYIFNSFKSDKPKEPKPAAKPFVVRAKHLYLNDVEYRMDLDKGRQAPIPLHGVSYQHQHYYGVTAHIKNIRVENDNIDCRIVNFEARERSGFHLADLSCDVKVSPYGISAQNMELVTDSTRLLLDGSLSFDTWDGLDPYLDSVSHRLVMRPGSVVDLEDVGYWVPIMWGVNDKVYLSGRAEGPVADMKVDSFDINVNNLLSFVVDGSVRGLPDVASTHFDVVVSRLSSSYQSASRIALPEQVDFSLPAILKTLSLSDGWVSLVGTPSNCKAQMTLHTGQGPLQADLVVDRNSPVHDYHAVAHLLSPGLRLSSLFPNDWVSHTGVRATIECQGPGYDALQGNVSGELFATVLRGVPIKAVAFEGTLDADHIDLDLDLDDQLLALSLSATLDRGTADPVFHADANIDHIQLSRLRLIDADSAISLSTHIRLEARGDDLERLSGNLSLSNSTLRIGSQPLLLHNALLSVREANRYKNISFTSDWLSCSVKGYVEYGEMPLLIRDFCQCFCPTYLSPWKDDAAGLSTDAAFSFDLMWKGEYQQFASLGIPLSIARGTTLSGSYNSAEKLRLVARSDSLGYGTLSLVDMGLIGRSRGDHYTLQLESDRLRAGSPSLLEDVRLKANVARSQSHLTLRSGNRGNMKNALLDLVVDSDTGSNRLHLAKGGFRVAGNDWHIFSNNDIVLKRDLVSVPMLLATDGTQSITASVSIQQHEDDFVRLLFHDFSLAWISNQWLSGSGYNVDGHIDGSASLRGLTTVPYLTADLEVNGCHVNDYQLGHLSLRSDWNADANLVNINVNTTTRNGDATFSPLTASGSINTGAQEPELDISCSFDHFPLKTVTPLLRSFASRFDGELLGHLYVGGTLQHPRVHGDAVVKEGLLAISATGVAYRFADTIRFADRRIDLSDFVVLDPRGNALVVDGDVIYEHSDVEMDLSLQSDNFMLLNIPERSDIVSGIIMSSLTGTVKGDRRRLDVSIAARTNRGSVLSVPVDDRKQVQQSNFISFVTPRGTENANADAVVAPSKNSPLNLSVVLDITPDLRLRLPMTFQQISPSLTASGSGNVMLSLVGGQKPVVTGGYELSSGSLNLELFSFLTTNFTIDPGSSIMLPGDVNNARFDIKASHLVHANLASLMGTAVETSGRTVNVEDVIVLSGTLAEPHVSFDLRFPNADKSVEEEVSVYIDRTNEREVLTQAMSLLLTGQFSNASSSSSMADNAASSGLNLMTSTLGSMVTNVVKVVDVNFGYQGETALTTEQFDIDIRKEWDRLYFETTLGYGGEARTLETPEATTPNLVGDVLVGYKLNPRVHLFVFNRTNTNDFTRAELPYKQGMGLKLTRDFDRWYDLFLKK